MKGISEMTLQNNRILKQVLGSQALLQINNWNWHAVFGAWKAAVHGVAEGQTRLSDFPFTFHFHALEEMATHSSVLAWRIPGTGEPGGLPSTGSHRVGHDWSDLAAAAAASKEHPGLISFRMDWLVWIARLVLYSRALINPSPHQCLPCHLEG